MKRCPAGAVISRTELLLVERALKLSVEWVAMEQRSDSVPNPKLRTQSDLANIVQWKRDLKLFRSKLREVRKIIHSHS